ncbi:MAG: CBS domain-containing protein [Rhodospirillaceae bacterium]|nr:CBS domain-containing protein [Rhodospirillaceae bacterium]
MNTGETNLKSKSRAPSAPRAIHARDIMSTSPITIEPNTNAHEIARILVEKRVSAVPVLDGKQVIGIVSEGDLLHRHELGTEGRRAQRLQDITDTQNAASDMGLDGESARHIMTAAVVTVTEDTSLADIVRTLKRHHIRRVLVMRRDALVGIISRSDILRALLLRPEGAGAPTDRNDDMVRYQVFEVLWAMPGTSPWATTVAVTKGVVELGGAIEDENMRSPSRMAIERIAHVREVKDSRSVLQPY